MHQNHHKITTTILLSHTTTTTSEAIIRYTTTQNTNQSPSVHHHSTRHRATCHAYTITITPPHTAPTPLITYHITTSTIDAAITTTTTTTVTTIKPISRLPVELHSLTHPILGHIFTLRFVCD
ncbi:hypothetical protein E2C01_098390 [Portunus trituberculatus]|uniref:Uncharacterized protein n=1 Tax=Portunus trituberculatus TaxID=210409 RepID=A0A5B7K7I7_PORTR|nr:hypothetical protein [Portunus trituberculatus]